MVAIAVSKNKGENVPLQIRCKGTPVGGYFFDIHNDCYLVNGVDFLLLGDLPFIAFIQSSEYTTWSSNFPLSEKIIKKYLDKEKNEYLSKFYDNHHKDCEIHYLQYTQEEA